MATVDEKEWKAAQTSAVIDEGMISIIGMDSEGNALGLSASGTTTGTYTISPSPTGMEDAHTASYTPANASMTNTTYSSIKKMEETVGGTLVITEIDEENQLISGTFTANVSRMNQDNETVTILAITNGSFNKVKYTTEPTTGPENSFSGKLDGASFTPTIVSGMTAFGKLTLNFSNSSSQTIGLAIPADIIAGEYALSGMGSTYSATYNESQNRVYEAASGKLTISKHDKAAKRVEGTFNFEAQPFPGSNATGTHSITEATFALTYK